MAKRRAIVDDDAEDLNELIQKEFVSQEEVDPKEPSKGSTNKKVKKSDWSVSKLVKNVAPPCPTNLDLKNWKEFTFLKRALLAGIVEKGYEEPTEIQSAILSDINVGQLVGSAPTGSGKTLAFSLPILNYLADRPIETGLTALILCPTRELAIQVSENIKTVGKYIAALRLATIVGGMSEEKQERQLSLNPTIIVATAGRLAEMAEFDQQLQQSMQSLRYLVIDEADRMILDKRGRFPDLEKLLKYCKSEKTFLFSATLSSDKIKKAFSSLRSKLNLQKPKQVHITGKLDLVEEKIQALDQSEKDKFLYLVTKEHQNKKTIIFVNSIEAVRRLHLLLSLFFESSSRPICPLHAQMQQRQRLKYLDRFKNSQNGILVCSDVAARGLDIPHVDMVIQAEVPKTLDIHKHRVGRTARAGCHGYAIIMICPKEAVHLKSTDDMKYLLKLSLANFHPGDHRIDAAIGIANEIEHLVFSNRKLDNEKRMTSKAHQELGGQDEFENDEMAIKTKVESKKIAHLKSQLINLLKH